MIRFTAKGSSFARTEKFLRSLQAEEAFKVLERYAQEGVAALANATPRDSGLTANSWTYEIVNKRGDHRIIFHNTHVEDGRPIAILLQYGHGTRTGGYVQGRDYINPVIGPLYRRLVEDVWKAVNK